MAEQSFNPEFDAFAADYDAALNQGLSVSGEDKNYFARGRLAHLAAILDRMAFTPYHVMDFGCGTGSAIPFVIERFPHLRKLVGTDISQRSLDVARRDQERRGTPPTASVEFRLMSDYAPSQELDLIFCNGVFHHIPLSERSACVKYIFDALRPGGLFALFENNPWNPGTRYVMSRIPFDRDAITLSPPTGRQLARAGGFQIVRTDSLFYFPRLLKWLRPGERLLHKLPLGTQYLVLAQKPAQ